MNNDINKIAYEIKKIRKQIVINDYEPENLAKQLAVLKADLKAINGHKQATMTLGNIIDGLRRNGDEIPACELRQQINLVLKEAESMKMKKRISRTRQAIAVQRFQKAKREERCEEIRLYDIIKAPTEGGLHHCIVVGTNGDKVSCLPMTTTTARSLLMLGRRFCTINDPRNPKKHVYLTDAAYTVSMTDAKRFFECHTEPDDDTLAAIDTLLDKKTRKQIKQQLANPRIAC